MKNYWKNTTMGALALLATSSPVWADDLTFWSWRPEDREVYEALFASFQEKNPDINIKFEGFEATSYATVLSTALAGETGPDLMQVKAYGAFEAVANAGYLSEISTDTVPGLADMPASAVAAETLRSDGKTYAVPYGMQTMLVIYNKDIYDDLGLKEPEAWEELLANAKAIKDAGKFAFANGTATAWQNETIASALVASTIGGDFYNDLLTDKADFTDARYVGGLEKLQEISEYFPDGFIGLDYPSSQQLFASGLAGMFAGGSFEIAGFRKTNPDLNIGVFAAPGQAAADPKLVAVFYDGGFAGNSSSEHQESINKFLAFTATHDFAQQFADLRGVLSPVPDVTIKDDVMNEVLGLRVNAVPYIMLTNFRYQEPSGSVLLQAAVQKMLAGESDPVSAAKSVTDGIATYYAPFQK